MSTIVNELRAAAARHSLDLVGLVAFVRVAELGSFVRAAENLELSKAAISKQVSALERRLGARLLHRTTRRLSLTEAGQKYLRHAQSALLAAQAAEGAVVDTQVVPQGRLRVTVPMTFGLMRVAPLTTAFLDAYPLIDLDLQLDDHPRDIVMEGLDLAIRFGIALGDSSLVARRIGDVRVVLCASPAYLDRRGRPHEPDDLSNHACLHYALNPTGRTWQLSRGQKTERIALAPRLETNSSLALREALLQHGGVARMPEFVVAEDVARGRLEIVLPDWEPPSMGIHAVMAERAYVPAKVRAFLEFMGAQWDRCK